MTDLSARLAAHRPTLLRFLERAGSGLLRFESVDDLAQLVAQRALEQAERFEDRGEEEFLGWVKTIARAVIADRHDHWHALKRGRGKVLRLTWSPDASRDPAAVSPPPQETAGPATRAAKREQLDLIVRVLAALPERDRSLVQWASHGVPLAEQAERLGIGYDAAQRAGHRALDRFKKAVRLATEKS